MNGKEHPAVFTMEDLQRLGLFQKGEIPKNLFLRDASGETPLFGDGGSSADRRHDLATCTDRLQSAEFWLRRALTTLLKSYARIGRSVRSPERPFALRRVLLRPFVDGVAPYRRTSQRQYRYGMDRSSGSGTGRHGRRSFPALFKLGRAVNFTDFLKKY